MIRFVEGIARHFPFDARGAPPACSVALFDSHSFFQLHFFMANYDLIVIGGGPAGYVAAIRAAQLGKKVACVEKDRAGGTCNNWGCIPTKVLLRNAELYHLMSHRAAEFGFKFDGLSFDWSKIIKRSRDVSDKGASGVEYLFKKNKVDYLRGEATIDKPGAVKVKAADGKEETHSAPKIFVSTGVVSRPLPGLPFNGKTVVGSKEAMLIDPQPKSMIIVGAGAIGIEFAYFYSAFGTKVTVVEMMPNILPVEDTEISQALEKAYAKLGIKVLTNTKTTKTEASDKGVKITVQDPKGAEQTLEADVALIAIGVQPLMPGGALKIGVTDRGYIQTNDRYETNVPGIYAAGDIIGPPWLAHVASYEAIQAKWHVREGFQTEESDRVSGLHLLPAAGRQRRLDGARGQGKGPQVQGRQIPFHGQRQGPRGRRDGWLCETDLRRAARGAARGAHHRGGSDRADCGTRAGDQYGGHFRGDRRDDSRASDAERSRA